MRNNISTQLAWATGKIINLSQNLAIAFNPEIADFSKTHQNCWTTQKLIHFSNSLAQVSLLK